MKLQKTIAAAALSSIPLLAATGCRMPAEEEEDWAPDAGGFDASAVDDIGPGEACPEGTPNLFNNAYSPYIGGEEDVLITISNCSYFRCPHCAHFSVLSKNLWDSRPDFMAHARLYYHHYPFSNETSWQLHASAAAAGRQGMENFWAVHDYLYGGMNADPQVLYSPEDVEEYVDAVLGLDMDRFRADRDDPATAAYLAWDKSQAQAQGVTGTPSVFVCGEKISWGAVEAEVDQYLNP